jgi:two-component system, NtrC family, sensor histidine kinase HydH
VRHEAEALIDALGRGSENAITATSTLDDVLVPRLDAATRLVAHLEEHERVTNDRLAALARELDLAYLAVLDADDRVLAASDTAVDPITDQHHYSLVANPRNRRPGSVLAGVAADDVLAFRRAVGVGRLLQDFGDNPDIAWAALQDDEGIIAASRGVTSLSSIDDDPFLAAAFTRRGAHSRLIDSTDAPVLEVVRALDRTDGDRMLTRVALRLDNVRRIQQRGLTRVAILAGSLLAGIVAVLALVALRGRFSALRDTHARVQGTTDLVLDNMADAVVAVDAAGTITVYNAAAARLFGRPPADMLTRSCTELADGDPLHLCSTLATHSPVQYDERELALAGGMRILGVSTSIIHRNGAVDLVIALARDLTEARRIRAQLEQRDRLSAMGSLAGGVAHEIRNPLNAIGMIVQRFRREFTPTTDVEEYRQLADTMRSEVQRVNSIITQFLEFARPPRPVRAREDLRSVVAHALDIVRSESAERGITLAHAAPDTPLPVEVDRHRMTQALLNIISNAFEAMEGGGTLTVAVSAPARIDIGDTGAGIPPEARARIFNLYYTTKATGTGLGLSIVHQIVSEHDGTIAVESAAADGTGARFVITLPSAHETAS